eukprot:8087006-Prorocentrum_lima.AAC.1
MTSSLVGSEMCIRDRSSGDPSVDQASSSRGAADSAAAAAAAAPLQSEAVSYTHLTLPTICSV